jgi:hypothetical protein
VRCLQRPYLSGKLMAKVKGLVSVVSQVEDFASEKPCANRTLPPVAVRCTD